MLAEGQALSRDRAAESQSKHEHGFTRKLKKFLQSFNNEAPRGGARKHRPMEQQLQTSGSASEPGWSGVEPTRSLTRFASQPVQHDLGLRVAHFTTTQGLHTAFAALTAGGASSTPATAGSSQHDGGNSEGTMHSAVSAFQDPNYDAASHHGSSSGSGTTSASGSVPGSAASLARSGRWSLAPGALPASADNTSARLVMLHSSASVSATEHLNNSNNNSARLPAVFEMRGPRHSGTTHDAPISQQSSSKRSSSSLRQTTAAADLIHKIAKIQKQIRLTEEEMHGMATSCRLPVAVSIRSAPCVVPAPADHSSKPPHGVAAAVASMVGAAHHAKLPANLVEPASTTQALLGAGHLVHLDALGEDAVVPGEPSVRPKSVIGLLLHQQLQEQHPLGGPLEEEPPSQLFPLNPSGPRAYLLPPLLPCAIAEEEGGCGGVLVLGDKAAGGMQATTTSEQRVRSQGVSKEAGLGGMQALSDVLQGMTL